jgi:perosamine synthetase
MVTREELAISGGPRSVPPDSHRRWPEILEADRAAVSGVLDRGVFSGANAPEITALQQEYADYLGVRHCLATNSGTAALHCCAVAAGVEPGDEVLVPAYTFVASAMAIAHQGAVPVFVDVDPRTYNIDPARIEERITERTRAILAVHIHGMPADMEEIAAVAERHGLAVLEDFAQSHGISYRDRKTGTLGLCGGTSLNASKNLSAGEGGLFVTDDDEALVAARRLSVFGEDLVPLEVRPFWAHGVGWNYRNQELSSALARAQLPRLDGYNATAMANGDVLTAGLEPLDGVTPPLVPDDRGTSYWKYMVQLDPDALGFAGPAGELRDRVLQALQAEGVAAMVWQPQPIPAQPAFRTALRPWHGRHDGGDMPPWDPGEYPVASRLCETSLALGNEVHPLYVQTPELMGRYVDAFAKVIEGIEAVAAAPFTPVKRIQQLD